MPITRDDLLDHCDHVLDAPGCRDYCHNGLQVEGAAAIETIATATTASQAMIDAAVTAGAQALLVHHGLIWGSGARRIHGMLHHRLKSLLQADCSLFAYHLPLDAHAEIGNNIVGLQALTAEPVGSFAEHAGIPIGWIGDLAAAEEAGAFAARCRSAFSHPVLHCPGHDGPIRRIGIVTGGGQSHLLDAAAAGCDAFVTGEASEQTWHEAAESGCHAFICGHHATECLAIHAWGSELARRFDLRHVRLDEANPI
ncbi:MAG: Nif3-like dinuclear metal center hexameric protein [Planctomycetota bacterium]